MISCFVPPKLDSIQRYTKAIYNKNIFGFVCFATSFGYDASGNRLWKKVTPKGSGAVTSTYYYLRDAQGNEMCRYVKYTNTTSQLMYVAQEHSIYGSSRVGVDNRKDTLYMGAAYTPTWGGVGTSRRDLGSKSFELANHLGNVLVTVSNKPIYKVSSTTIYFNPEVTSISDYYPFGAPINGRGYASEAYRFGFNGKEIDEEVNGAGNSYDYGVRMYSARLCRWFSVDPKTNLRIEWTPYNYCRNNPKNKTDPTGALDAPIYDENANFLGTDDEGLKGKAIVMNKANFKQGMSHEDALSKSIGVEGFKVKGARTKYLDHYNGLKSRPDYDGYLTWAEANKWYGEGNGQPLFTSLEKIDLSGILSLGENFVGEVDHFNLQLLGNSINDGLVYGSITLKRYPDHQVRAYQDHYDFEMHDASNPLNWPRNVETLIGKEFAGEGQKFDIKIYVSKKLTPILPWIN